jgi:hypothetical protein
LLVANILVSGTIFRSIGSLSGKGVGLSPGSTGAFRISTGGGPGAIDRTTTYPPWYSGPITVTCGEDSPIFEILGGGTEIIEIGPEPVPPPGGQAEEDAVIEQLLNEAEDRMASEMLIDRGFNQYKCSKCVDVWPLKDCITDWNLNVECTSQILGQGTDEISLILTCIEDGDIQLKCDDSQCNA